MVTHYRRWLTACLIGLLANTVLRAEELEWLGTENVMFMPGDAFFHTFLREQQLKESQLGEFIAFDYDMPPATGSFGGYAGFRQIQIKGASPEFIERLRLVYKTLRKNCEYKEVRIMKHGDGAEKQLEMNPPLAFIYNKGIDWDRQTIGLKFNENWMSPPEQAKTGNRFVFFGRRSITSQYIPFVRSADAVVQDWKLASKVEPLKVEVPAVEGWALLGAPIDEPVTIAAQQVEIVVVVHRMLDSCYRRKDDAMFYRLNSEQAYECTWNDRKITTEVINAEE